MDEQQKQFLRDTAIISIKTKNMLIRNARVQNGDYIGAYMTVLEGAMDLWNLENDLNNINK